MMWEMGARAGQQRPGARQEYDDTDLAPGVRTAIDQRNAHALFPRLAA
jgi:hypothetical protein